MPLDLPEPDTTPLARSPLELVVCQIKHERRPAASDAQVALRVREALGGESGRYPQFDDITGTHVSVAMNPQGPPNIARSETSGWRFASADGKWVITMLEDSFALETSAYTTWRDDFAPRLDELIDVIAEHVSPAIEQRIGLRYIDRVSELGLTSVAAWEPYLRPELLGLALHPELGQAVRAAHQQVILEINGGVQCGLRHGPVFVEESGTVDYVLDFDVYRERGRAFDTADVKQTATAFNKCALQLFHATVTERLREELA